MEREPLTTFIVACYTQATHERVVAEADLVRGEKTNVAHQRL